MRFLLEGSEQLPHAMCSAYWKPWHIMLLPMLWGIDGVWISVVVAEFMSLVLGGFFLIVKRKTYHYEMEEYDGLYTITD